VFSAGETLQDLHLTIGKLSAIDQGIIIDYCAEGVTSELGMNETVSQIEQAIKISSKFPNSAVAIKLTALIPEHTLKKLNQIQKKHLKISADVWKNSIFLEVTEKMLEKEGLNEEEIKQTLNGIRRIRTICKDCGETGVSVMIDAEQTYFQHAIDGLTAMVMMEYNKDRGIVLNTIQSYLTDSTEKLKSYLEWSSEFKLKTGVKLVRGAYIKEESTLALKNSYPNPIHSTKEETDHCYNENLKIMISNMTRNSSLCVATHNKESIFYAKELMQEFKIHRLFGGISFAQLLGMKTMISTYLTHEHYIVQKYTPFGPFNKLMPYLGRRAHEMAHMISDIDNQIELIMEELKIRGSN
jgi:proline dehydrogenase